MHCINAIVICDENGKIIFLAVSFYGMTHDSKCMNILNINDKFNE